MPNLVLLVESCSPPSKFAALEGQEKALRLRIKTTPMVSGTSLQPAQDKSLHLSYSTNVSSGPSRAHHPRLGWQWTFTWWFTDYCLLLHSTESIYITAAWWQCHAFGSCSSRRQGEEVDTSDFFLQARWLRVTLSSKRGSAGRQAPYTQGYGFREPSWAVLVNWVGWLKWEHSLFPHSEPPNITSRPSLTLFLCLQRVHLIKEL